MSLFKGTLKVVIGIVLLTVLTLSLTEKVSAQTMPITPRLSLVGDDGSYDMYYYPDGRLWLPTSQGEPREFLLPVFINNNWLNYWELDPTRKKYIPNDITSFKFSLMYDSKTLQAVGVETAPPEYYDVTTQDILARNFNFDTYDVKDNNYWFQIDQDHWASTNEKEDGRRFTIVATSTEALPNSSGAKQGRFNYDILLFVRFKVIAELELGQKPDMISKKPLYIDNREIRYNDMDVTKDRPIKEMSYYDINFAATDYPGAPTKNITGISNEETSFFNLEPYTPGSIAVHFFDKLPAFDLTTILLDNPIIDMYAASNNVADKGKYVLWQSITIDSNCAAPKYAEVTVRLANKETGTRMMFPKIQTNTDWLKFKINGYTPNYQTFSYGDLTYLDNGILGGLDPLGAETPEQQPVFLSVVADPSELSSQGIEEKAGNYDGFISFSAPYAEVNPVRLYVKFDFIRNPFEPEFNKSAAGETGGINLSMYNSSSATGDSVKLVFGTGIRATEFAERLFGEEPHASEMNVNNFDARFYPTFDLNKLSSDDQTALAPLYNNGFRDIAPNTYNPRTNSRDIRPYSNETGTYLYHVKFSAGGADNYPVVVEWDINDFPAESQLYLRDAENGKLFPAIDMRKANQLSATRRSYTFTDARISEYYIEYTLPANFNFVTESGKPAIRQGWNMLSLPVRPMNNHYNNVYPNAINIPYRFTLNQHQEVDNGLLFPGNGYFVKYSSDTTVLDRIFKGSMIYEIKYIAADLESDMIKVYPSDEYDPNNPITSELGAWNMVGALSVPTSIEGISFSAYKSGSFAPDKAFTHRFGVWQYLPKQGYKEVQMLLPGYGYWIKTDKLGYYNLEIANAGPKASVVSDDKFTTKENSCKLNIIDNAQNNGELYLNANPNIDIKYFELPPMLSSEVFDVRFADGKYLTNATENVIELNGVTYPVVLKIDNADADYNFTDAVTGIELGSISKGFTGNVVVNKLSSGAIKFAKTVVNANQSGMEVYPNPVVNVSTVSYSVNEDANVTVKLYDAVGNEVDVLVNEFMKAGNYNTVINANNLNNGSYICKVIAGENTSIVKVTVVK